MSKVPILRKKVERGPMMTGTLDVGGIHTADAFQMAARGVRGARALPKATKVIAKAKAKAKAMKGAFTRYADKDRPFEIPVNQRKRVIKDPRAVNSEEEAEAFYARLFNREITERVGEKLVTRIDPSRGKPGIYGGKEIARRIGERVQGGERVMAKVRANAKQKKKRILKVKGSSA